MLGKITSVLNRNGHHISWCGQPLKEKTAALSVLCMYVLSLPAQCSMHIRAQYSCSMFHACYESWFVFSVLAQCSISVLVLCVPCMYATSPACTEHATSPMLRLKKSHPQVFKVRSNLLEATKREPQLGGPTDEIRGAGISIVNSKLG
jgi:hypothetical protein